MGPPPGVAALTSIVLLSLPAPASADHCGADATVSPASGPPGTTFVFRTNLGAPSELQVFRNERLVKVVPLDGQAFVRYRIRTGPRRCRYVASAMRRSSGGRTASPRLSVQRGRPAGHRHGREPARHARRTRSVTADRRRSWRRRRSWWPSGGRGLRAVEPTAGCSSGRPLGRMIGRLGVRRPRRSSEHLTLGPARAIGDGGTGRDAGGSADPRHGTEGGA